MVLSLVWVWMLMAVDMRVQAVEASESEAMGLLQWFVQLLSKE
jgi:hypothetical protein